MDFVCLNHRFVPKVDAFIPINDRGFRFGDGVFETIRVVNHVPYQWEYHLNRLQKGLETLRIPFDTQTLLDSCKTLIAKNQLSEGFLRIAISRGVGSQGYLPTTTTPTLVIETLPLVSPPDKPVELWLSSYQKPSAASLPVHIKTMQGLNSTLARMEAQDNQCFESLLLNQNSQLCEGSSSNIFWVKAGKLYTPSLDAGILPGSMRETVLRLSPLPVEQGLFPLEALQTAEEVFLTNVAWLALPVSSLQPTGYTWGKYAFTQTLNALIHEDMVRYASNNT